MESMAVESLVSSAWHLDGYLTRTRWPVRVPGNYSDVDVIGVSAGGRVRIAECKVRGTAHQVLVASGDFGSWLGSWSNCLDNIHRLWEERPDWIPRIQDTTEFEFWFCANLWFPSKQVHTEAEARFTEMISSACPHGLKGKARGVICSTRDVIFDVICKVRQRIVDEGHGRRFGDPLLDAVRELVRYSFPHPTNGGRVGDEIKDETQALLTKALSRE